MTGPMLSRAVATLLAAEDVKERAPSGTERDRAVEAIKAALSLRAQRGKRRRWALPLAGVAAAAAFLVIGGALWSRRAAPAVASPTSQPRSVVADTVRGTVLLEQNGERVALRSLAPVTRGSTVIAMDGEALLLTQSGSKVDVEHATTASLIEDGDTELMRLERGAITSTVTKRGAGQRFIIQTPDAEVEVRGTVFRVSRLDDPRCGMQTRVHVDEGRVVVRAAQGGTTLERGGEWVSSCATAAMPTASGTVVVANGEAPTAAVEPSAAPRALGTSRGTPAAATTSAAAPPVVPSTAAAPSELAAQNALFADAMASRGRGDTRSALTSLEFLLDKYPRTPLREAAEAQRMMLASGADRARGATLARAYLSRYPHGFARADAEKIAGDTQ